MKAFPCKAYVQDKTGVVGISEHAGMDLRDYFAAKALQGMFAGGDTEHLDKSEISEWAFKYADAMMEARKK